LRVILLAMNILRLLRATAQPEVDLKRTDDAIVIGSGAAGGMAAHVLTSQGATRVDPLVALRHSRRRCQRASGRTASTGKNSSGKASSARAADHRQTRLSVLQPSESDQYPGSRASAFSGGCGR
jgi:choline dehydrogenase-like flavoprotein